MVLHLLSSTKLITPHLRKTEDALCEYILAKQGMYLEGAITFPHEDRTSRNSDETRLSFEDRFGGLSMNGGAKIEKGTKIACACIY